MRRTGKTAMLTRVLSAMTLATLWLAGWGDASGAEQGTDGGAVVLLDNSTIANNPGNLSAWAETVASVIDTYCA